MIIDRIKIESKKCHENIKIKYSSLWISNK